MRPQREFVANQPTPPNAEITARFNLKPLAHRWASDLCAVTPSRRPSRDDLDEAFVAPPPPRIRSLRTAPPPADQIVITDADSSENSSRRAPKPPNSHNNVALRKLQRTADSLKTDNTTLKKAKSKLHRDVCTLTNKLHKTQTSLELALSDQIVATHEHPTTPLHSSQGSPVDHGMTFMNQQPGSGGGVLRPSMYGSPSRDARVGPRHDSRSDYGFRMMQANHDAWGHVGNAGNSHRVGEFEQQGNMRPPPIYTSNHERELVRQPYFDASINEHWPTATSVRAPLWVPTPPPPVVTLSVRPNPPRTQDEEDEGDSTPNAPATSKRSRKRK